VVAVEYQKMATLMRKSPRPELRRSGENVFIKLAFAYEATTQCSRTDRVEALGLLAGMHFAQKWKGQVEWKIDNTSVIHKHSN
jgi:hypothetical protein